MVDDLQLDVGVDVADALGHHFSLGSALGGAEGEELAVAVRRVHHVAIDESHLADASPGKLLGSVGSHAA